MGESKCFVISEEVLLNYRLAYPEHKRNIPTRPIVLISTSIRWAAQKGLDSISPVYLAGGNGGA